MPSISSGRTSRRFRLITSTTPDKLRYPLTSRAPQAAYIEGGRGGQLYTAPPTRPQHIVRRTDGQSGRGVLAPSDFPNDKANDCQRRLMRGAARAHVLLPSWYCYIMLITRAKRGRARSGQRCIPMATTTTTTPTLPTATAARVADQSPCFGYANFALFARVPVGGRGEKGSPRALETA